MNNGLDTLKEIGAQKIHNETHISREYVQSIIHRSFEGLNRVQFLGFISILEREYNVDLSELKASGLDHFKDDNANPDEPHKVFVVSDKKKNNSTVYILLGSLIFISVAYYTFVYLSSISPTAETLDNTKIQNAQKNINTVEDIEFVEDANETNTTINAVDANITKVIEPELEIIRTLKILPKNRIWAGYINIETNQKYQKIFTEEFAIDTTKNWLLLFGAGAVKLEVNGEIKKYSSDQNQRFKYVDGEWTKITVTEFKSLNKGRKW